MAFFNFCDRLVRADERIQELIKPCFESIEQTALYNQQKVLKAFINNRVSERHLGGSTGYGYGDDGRDTLDRVKAECMGAQDALIRTGFASGTHTLSVALFGILRPKDRVLCLTGRPYDTIIGVFGIDKKTDGSLADFGIEYNQVELKSDGTPDIDAIRSELKRNKYKVAYIQRSRGYSLRPSLCIEDIKTLCETVREVSSDTVILVDNCYGEFVEKQEPCDVGADLVAGSLIKNPGGGIAPCGGYIAGKKEYIEMCAHRMTCAGVGREVGATLGHNRELYMGLFAAPHTVSQALKTAVYASALLETAGFEVTPKYNEKRADIIQCITLGSGKALTAFCRGMQSGSPVDAFVSPEPWDMPGYDDKVVMAAGAFTSGASIELSADGPLRPPFAAWMQGGLNYESGKTGVMLAVQSMIDAGVIEHI